MKAPKLQLWETPASPCEYMKTHKAKCFWSAPVSVNTDEGCNCLQVSMKYDSKADTERFWCCSGSSQEIGHQESSQAFLGHIHRGFI